MFPRVRDYMDTVVHTLRPEDSVHDAVAMLLERRVTGAPVVKADHAVVGIITAKDCLRLLAVGAEDAVSSGTVAEFMTPNPTTVTPGMNIYFVAGMFLRNVVRRFPVVEGGRLVGAITSYDILRAIRDLRAASEGGG